MARPALRCRWNGETPQTSTPTPGLADRGTGRRLVRQEWFSEGVLRGRELAAAHLRRELLGGLSEGAGQVCVMMTAMDVGHLPPALIRSGRIELWLEMRLPDEAARTAILQQMIAPLGAPFAAIDLPPLVKATAGFTGADLKRLLDDGKNLYAFDRARAQPLAPVTDYFLRAVETVKDNKDRYAEAEARARQQRASPAV